MCELNSGIGIEMKPKIIRSSSIEGENFLFLRIDFISMSYFQSNLSFEFERRPDKNSIECGFKHYKLYSDLFVTL